MGFSHMLSEESAVARCHFVGVVLGRDLSHLQNEGFTTRGVDLQQSCLVTFASPSVTMIPFTGVTPQRS